MQSTLLHTRRRHKQANRPASQPSYPLGVFLAIGGIAVISYQIMASFHDIYTPSLRRPETRLCVWCYQIRHAIVLALSEASRELVADAKDLTDPAVCLRLTVESI